MFRFRAIAAIVTLAMFVSMSHARAAPDAARGEELYQSCQDCHSLDSNDVGPMHRGVFGRKAGTVANYSYSQALQTSGIIWDAGTLDQWLANPQSLVPGSKMFFHLDAAQDRADIIEYLKERAK